MILSASRRTDIPAFYMEWFMKRLRSGEVWVANPVNLRKIGRIHFDRETLDGIVFWSKNPAPLLHYIQELSPYPWYLQYTLNAYGKDVEPGLPSLEERTAVFKALAEAAGPERVVWRYDPVFFSEQYTLQWHLAQFQSLAGQLAGSTEQCVFSFLDYYRNTEKRMEPVKPVPGREGEIRRLAAGFSRIASENGMALCTCAEQTDFSEFGIRPGKCVDAGLLGRIGGVPLKVRKDYNQRKECGCVSSIDVGTYHTCPHGCLYCYASGRERAVRKNRAMYDEDALMLCRTQKEGDEVLERKIVSHRKV